LTNFSTGRLGTELTKYLIERGHEVKLLLGEMASFREAINAEIFSTTSDLREQLQKLTSRPPDAVFHAAAVNDFGFGRVWARSDQGELKELTAGKYPTREGTLLAELVPTPKVIAELRQWFPVARLVGWKYEVDGTREDVIREGEKQLAVCLTDACVTNGPAYGDGFGLVEGVGEFKHFGDKVLLFTALEKLLRQSS
jgi:phosphopantothenoylcysteine decarboxylase/phosphopantothenate--cysteine ligase